MIRPENGTGDFLLAITKNLDKLIKQIHRKPQESLEFKPTQPHKTFSSKASSFIGLDSEWMIELTSLEVKKCIFKITEEINKLDFYTDLFDEFLFLKLKDELEQILGLSDISHEHLPDKITGPRFVNAYKNLSSEKGQTDGYNLTIMAPARSSFPKVERFRRIVVGLAEDDVQLIFQQHNSNFATYEEP